MEIERKFLPKTLPEIHSFPCHRIEQAYLCTNPVVRIRQEDENYYLTYKANGFLAREEYNLPLTKESYKHLLKKADGNIITKKRILIPYESYTIELDLFEGCFSGLMIAEVEFDSTEQAERFIPPDWFGDDVTYDERYHNSYLSAVHIKKGGL